MINILLVEDHILVRDGIKFLLSGDPDINVIDVAADGLTALDKLKQGLDVSIVITDINMPHMDGLALATEVIKLYPDIKVVILTMLDDEKNIHAAFQSGVKGYLLKEISVKELIFAINHIAANNRYVSSRLAMEMLDNNMGFYLSNEPMGVALTARESEILELVSMGLTNIEIAEKLFTSKRTVEGHRQNLLDKTGTKNTAALIRYAIQHKMIKNAK